MSLVADYESDSDGSNSTEESLSTDIKTEIKRQEDTSSDEEKKLPPPSFKLPAPKFGGETVEDDCEEDESSGSVFVNPFLEAENAKEAILQKHVKMVNAKDVIRINGKKICWNYRKGRCRFGHNCKYAHDSDVQKTEQQLSEELEVAKARAMVCHYSGATGQKSVSRPLQDESEELSEEVKKKRKRPGLSQGLVPGKKVMKQYLHNKT
ncbi:uncharacterized protein LOC126746260 [Anthonomus grandis grandis]|uniref:uncharacterized protein LOC126746260 n=1 Tax=Anthonomus grandis grandis TaxID=2921223 RepID=UPI00216641EA|nr:uncharacterized protein LOC126746260 [Anthonomus grandis grandis]